jgi:putative ATPase
MLKINKAGQVPLHLRDAHYPRKKLKSQYRFIFILYAFPGNWVRQDFCLKKLKVSIFYDPTGKGMDKNRGKPDA